MDDNNSSSNWVAIVLLTIILGITSGIIVHVYSNEKREESTLKQANEFERMEQEEKSNIVKVSSNEEKTTPNTTITFETYYNKCGHVKINKKTIDKDDVNKSLNEIKEKYNDYSIESFNKDEIVLKKEVDKLCDDHYIVREDDGYISVYNVDENGNETLKNRTDILTKYLPNEDIDLLKKGIKANGANKLDEILSDYE